MRKSRKSKDKGKSARGKTVSVQFFTDEDRLIRELARQDGNRSVSDTVRVLALAEAKRRAAAVVMGGPVDATSAA
jgi:hypothetical protein